MLNNPGEKTVIEAFEDFIRYKKAKNLSDSTLIYYHDNIKKFIDWLDTDELKEITEDTIQEYTLYLETEFNLSDESVNTYLRAVRVFLYYCMKFGYCKKFKVELIRTQDKVKSTYTQEEIKILLKKPNTNKCNFATYRG